jgi:AAA domain
MTDKLALISRDLSLAPPGAKQSMFVDRVSTIGGTIGISPEMVGQKLWDIARAHELTGEPGSGTEEFIGYEIERAVARVEEGKPRAPNGGDADHERASGKTETSKKPKRDMPRAWWRDPGTIPARSSLYDGHYIRRTIGATIGGGGRAKTTRGIYEAISMAVGFDIATKDKLPAGELRVWICNGEEDQDELDRRVAAACQRYGISQADLGDRLFVQSVRVTRCASPPWSTTGRRSTRAS